MTESNELRRSGGGGSTDPTGDLRRRLLLIGGLGFAIGAVFVLFIGTVLWSVGVLHLGAAPGCPEAKTTCPPTPAFLPACPTCEVQIQEVTVPPPTATETPTPDLQATATAACGNFQAQFPGTPCPPFETATPTPTP